MRTWRSNAAPARRFRPFSNARASRASAPVDQIGGAGLLARPDREAVLHELARLREPLYAQVADLRFDTGCLTAAAATEQLARLLERHWQRTSTPIRTGTDQ